MAQASLPRADLFDVLPALHELLSRIDHSTPADVPAANITDLAATAEHEDAAYAELAPLEPRDLPNEALSIKTKIRRTLRELEKLDDMNRSVEQQELEIESLEKRIQQQRALLAKLNAAAVSSNAG